MRETFLFLASLLFVHVGNASNDPRLLARQLYTELAAIHTVLPDSIVFQEGVMGYFALKNRQELDKSLLIIVDFGLSSNKKRLWVIDMDRPEILYHTLVAHGRNSGEEYAKSFSNRPQSYQSSLGFYITGNTYHGKHGLSLYLNGIEEGINDNAKERSIVMHGADYVSRLFIKKHGRLGRSFGCPSLPMEMHEEIINKIKGKSCLFIYHPDERYHSHSKLLKFSPLSTN
jgi:hypothetical protein